MKANFYVMKAIFLIKTL